MSNNFEITEQLLIVLKLATIKVADACPEGSAEKDFWFDAQQEVTDLFVEKEAYEKECESSETNLEVPVEGGRRIF